MDFSKINKRPAPSDNSNRTTAKESIAHFNTVPRTDKTATLYENKGLQPPIYEGKINDLRRTDGKGSPVYKEAVSYGVNSANDELTRTPSPSKPEQKSNLQENIVSDKKNENRDDNDDGDSGASGVPQMEKSYANDLQKAEEKKEIMSNAAKEYLNEIMEKTKEVGDLVIKSKHKSKGYEYGD